MRTLNVFGKRGKIKALLPFTHLTGDAKLAGQDTSGTRTGFADARLRFSVNLIGSLELAPKDFRRFRQETIVRVGVVVAIPVGQYDQSKRINIGCNRWGFKPDLGLSHRFGRWSVQACGSVSPLTDNNEFLDIQTRTRSALQFSMAYFVFISIRDLAGSEWCSCQWRRNVGGRGIQE